MNWSDERYVKLYVRPTATYRLWPWQTKAIFPWLLARCDGSGLIDVGRHGIQGVAALVEMPLEVVEAGMKTLVEDGTVEAVPRGFLVPKFIEAQEATKTERAKKRDQRERMRSQAREVVDAPVPSCPELSPSVPLQPSPAQPSPAHVEDIAPAAQVAERKAPKKSKPSPVETPEVRALRESWNELTKPPIPKWTAGRVQTAQAALERRPLEQWREVFERINKSDFLRGQSGTWKADIDWALRPEGTKPEPALKVLEGTYDNGKTPVGSGDWRGREDHNADFFGGDT